MDRKQKQTWSGMEFQPMMKLLIVLQKNFSEFQTVISNSPPPTQPRGTTKRSLSLINLGLAAFLKMNPTTDIHSRSCKTFSTTISRGALPL